MTQASPASAVLLVVDGCETSRAALRSVLEAHGYQVIDTGDQAGAEQALQGSGFVIVIVDLQLKQGGGLGVLRVAKRIDPDMPVIVIAAEVQLSDVVMAMREGALDVMAKPVDPDHLIQVVDGALCRRRAIVKDPDAAEAFAIGRGAPPIVGRHESLRRALNAVQKAALSDTTVLLEGDSGTGKELFARRLHVLSGRVRGPFVAINCAAIPEHLLESELFGHEKGAFTGAIARKLGKFELAHRGTLFLDEIADLPIGLQPKLLRALESRQVDRVGGTGPVTVDVRVVAATNRSLRDQVTARRFREDLYFRLSVFPVVIPPLRERAGDIPRLAQYFVERVCRVQGIPTLPLTPGCLEALESHHWPGNVRELQNCLERAVVLCDAGPIEAHHLNLQKEPLGVPARDDPWDRIDLSGSLPDASRRILAEVERRKIESALRAVDGDAMKASDALKIPYRTMIGKLREYRLNPRRIVQESHEPADSRRGV